MPFLYRTLSNEDQSDEVETSSTNPSCFCLSRQLCLTFVFISVFTTAIKQNKQLSFCPSETKLSLSFRCSVQEKKSSMVSSICGCIHMCYVRHSYSFAAPPGSEGGRRSREEEEEETLKKKQLQEEQLSKVCETIPVFISGKYVCPTAWCEYILMNMCLMCRSNLVWGSSFWRKRGKKSRSGSVMLAASPPNATTPNKAAAMQVRAASRTALSLCFNGM